MSKVKKQVKLPARRQGKSAALERATPAKARTVEVKPARKAPPAPAAQRKAATPAPVAPPPAAPASGPARPLPSDMTQVKTEAKLCRPAPEPGAMERVEWSGQRNGIKYVAGFDKAGNLIITCPKPFCIVSTVDVTIVPWRNE